MVKINNKKISDNKNIIIGIGIILVICAIILALFNTINFQTPPQGLMILIESTGEPTGLDTMVEQMKQRDITGILMVTPEFVNNNCEAVKKALSYEKLELVPSNVGAPFWGIPYEEQKSRIVTMMDEIEECVGFRPRIISSRYMASDMNTIKVAEELGIEYVTARGTTGNKATVYEIEDYNVKILSVSLIALVPFEYGSLCDFSFYERAGCPSDMREELDRAMLPLTDKEIGWFGEHHRITPTSHTYIGGGLKIWNDMWLDYWNTNNVNWVTLDEFMSTPDWVLPLWQIPINQNNPYTVEKVHPLIPYEDDEKVDNMCSVI